LGTRRGAKTMCPAFVAFRIPDKDTLEKYRARPIKH
jgi:hypothetical protein